jgi:DNA-binding transcriptional LysR family regulator
MEDSLRRGSADLLIYPVEIAERFADLPRTVLFEDRFVLAADRDNLDIAEGVDLSRFSELPYLAVSGPFPSLVETQLDALGISRRTEFTTQAFVAAPLLLAGTRLIGLVQERLARTVSEHANLAILPAPMALRPLVEAMYWNPRNTDDPGHRWLRERLVAQAARLDSPIDRGGIGHVHQRRSTRRPVRVAGDVRGGACGVSDPGWQRLCGVDADAGHDDVRR